MEVVLKLPIDLTQLPPYRHLRDSLGDASKALHVWFILWQELLYRMQEGNEPGIIPCRDEEVFLKALEPVDADPEKRASMFQALKESKLLKQDGDNYVCPRFQVLHSGVSHSPSSISRLGGSMKAFNTRMQDVNNRAFQQTLCIADYKFKDETGEPLTEEVTRRITRLIIACDNALFKNERPPAGYTEGLIQDALKVVKRYADEQIDYICRTVALHRDHAALRGMLTEKLLGIFPDIVPKLGGLDG